MRHRLVFAYEIFAVLLLVLPTSAHAQTAAVGPYYATPSWDQTIACASLASCPRFIVLANFNNEAVLDRETGLVWEKSPSLNFFHLFEAEESCIAKSVGGRQGWRLPTMSELRTLVDPTRISPALALPAGHPFLNVELFFYWTETPSRNPVADDGIYVLDFHHATGGVEVATAAGAIGGVWCVRGPGATN